MAEQQNIPFPPYPGPLMKPSTWRALQRYCEDRPVVRRIKGEAGIDVTQHAPGFYTVKVDDDGGA